MSEELESRLRRALRPVDPGGQFTQRVLERVGALPPRSAAHGRTRLVRWVSVALAASVAASLLVIHERQTRRAEEGAEARMQVLEALRVTSEKLDIAYRAVNNSEGASTEAEGDRGT